MCKRRDDVGEVELWPVGPIAAESDTSDRFCSSYLPQNLQFFRNPIFTRRDFEKDISLLFLASPFTSKTFPRLLEPLIAIRTGNNPIEVFQSDSSLGENSPIYHVSPFYLTVLHDPSCTALDGCSYRETFASSALAWEVSANNCSESGSSYSMTRYREE